MQKFTLTANQINNQTKQRISQTKMCKRVILSVLVIVCCHQLFYINGQRLLLETTFIYSFSSSEYNTVQVLSSAIVLQLIPWNIKYINADKATEYVGKEAYSKVQVAVIDTGVDYDHEEFRKRVFYINGYPYYYWGKSCITWGYNVITDEEGLEAVEDYDGHGTACVGIIAALNNDVGIIGVAPGINVYVIKRANEATEELTEESLNKIIEAIKIAAMGPDGIIGTDDDPEVISMSFGFYIDYPELHNIIKWAYNKGIVLVAAAGNKPDLGTSFPAKYPEVIAVGSVDENGHPSSFSSPGEIYAPGENIKTTFKGNGYAIMEGTSFACPHVAATVALMIAEDLKDKKRDLTPKEIREILINTAKQVNVNGKTIRIVDAYAAVKAVTSYNSNPSSDPPIISPYAYSLASSQEDFYENTTKLIVSWSDEYIIDPT